MDVAFQLVNQKLPSGLPKTNGAQLSLGISFLDCAFFPRLELVVAGPLSGSTDNDIIVLDSLDLPSCFFAVLKNFRESRGRRLARGESASEGVIEKIARNVTEE